MARRGSRGDTEFAVRVEGLSALNRDLGRINKDLQKASKAKLRLVAKQVRGTARGFAPRKTGRLAGSLRYSATAKGARVTSSLDYAPVHEYGGTISPAGGEIHIRRSRFVGRAVKQDADRIEHEIADLLDFIARRHGFH